MYLDAGKALSEVSNSLPLRIRNVKKLIRDASFVIRSVSKGIHSRRNRIRCRIDNWSNAAKCMRDASSVIRSVSKGIHSARNRIRCRIDNWSNAAKCMRDASSVIRSVSKGIHYGAVVMPPHKIAIRYEATTMPAERVRPRHAPPYKSLKNFCKPIWLNLFKQNVTQNIT